MKNYIIVYDYTIVIKGLDYPHLDTARGSLGFKADNGDTDEEIIEKAKEIIEGVKMGWRFCFVIEA